MVSKSPKFRIVSLGISGTFILCYLHLETAVLLYKRGLVKNETLITVLPTHKLNPKKTKGGRNQDAACSDACHSV